MDRVHGTPVLLQGFDRPQRSENVSVICVACTVCCWSDVTGNHCVAPSLTDRLHRLGSGQIVGIEVSTDSP